MRLSRPFRTRFRSGSASSKTWPRRITQLAGLFYKRHAARVSPRNILSVHGFRFYFTPLVGVLFAFPSRYLFAIGSCLVFSLGSWSTRIPAGFLVPRRTQDSAKVSSGFAYAALTLCGRPSHAVPLPYLILYRSPTTPHMRFGLFPVRSPLLGESLLISFPGLLRWFTSPSMASGPYFIQNFGCNLITGYPIRKPGG